MVGNIFFTYKEIDPTGDLFKSWVELTGPVWEMIGSDPSDVPSMKRWLSFLEGGLLPIISLTSLHFFVKYEKVNPPKEETISPIIDTNDNQNVVVEEIDSPKDTEDSTKTHLQKEADRVWDTVKKLKEEGVFPEATEEEIMNEPTALANSKYREEYNENVDDDIIESYMFPTTTYKVDNNEDDGVRRLTYTKPS